MPSSWVNTECSIHRVQHTPKIVCCPFILTISSWPVNVTSASGIPPFQSTATSQFSIRASKVKSPCHIPTVASWLTDELGPGVPSIACLQVLVQSRWMTASKCISKLAWSWPQRACPNSPDHGLQVSLIMASKCISKLAWSWPACASLTSFDLSLQLNLQTRSITASKCIAEFTRSPSPSASATRSMMFSLKERQRLCVDTGIMEVDRVTGSIYLADRSQSRYSVCRWVAI